MNDLVLAPKNAQELPTVPAIPGAIVPLHQNPAAPADIVAFDLGPSTSTEPFTLPSFSWHCIAIPTTGGYLAEGRANGESHKTHVRTDGRNGLLLLPGGYASKWRFHKLSVCYSALFLSPSLLARVVPQDLSADPIQATLRPVLFFEDPLLFQVGLAIARAMRAAEPGCTPYIESLSHTLAAHLLKRYATMQPGSAPIRGKLPGQLVRQVMDVIETAPDSDLRLSKLAELAHLSPYHFARLFRQTVGQTLHRYVLEQRLTRGRQLLLDSDLSLAQIAAELGFADESHFLRRFKDFYGITPGTLRKERKLIP